MGSGFNLAQRFFSVPRRSRNVRRTPENMNCGIDQAGGDVIDETEILRPRVLSWNRDHIGSGPLSGAAAV